MVYSHFCFHLKPHGDQTRRPGAGRHQRLHPLYEMARRIQGREPPPNLAHLPNVRLTPLDWGRVVWENVVWMVTDFPKLWLDHRGRKR